MKHPRIVAAAAGGFVLLGLGLFYRPLPASNSRAEPAQSLPTPRNPETAASPLAPTSQANSESSEEARQPATNKPSETLTASKKATRTSLFATPPTAAPLERALISPALVEKSGGSPERLRAATERAEHRGARATRLNSRLEAHLAALRADPNADPQAIATLEKNLARRQALERAAGAATRNTSVD